MENSKMGRLAVVNTGVCMGSYGANQPYVVWALVSLQVSGCIASASLLKEQVCNWMIFLDSQFLLEEQIKA